MLLQPVFAPLFLLAMHLTINLACSTRANSTNNTSQYPYTITGSDEPADWATMGYVLNHLSLNVRNLTISMDFYTQVFGMRLIFSFRATEQISITYLAHSHGGKNGTQYQTASELNRYKNNMEGMLELLNYKNSPVDLSPSSKASNTFSHLGMVVPDIIAMQARLDVFGIKILKRTGDGVDSVDVDGKKAIAEAYGFGDLFKTNPAEAEAFFKLVLEQVPGAIDFIIILDPDGNMIEIQPQELGQLNI